MGGQWLGSSEPPHRCRLPSIDLFVAVGARWQCDCGIIYKVVRETQLNEQWKQWEREE